MKPRAGSPSKIIGNRWETGRTEAFSDAVFAIAITLLVLDIRVPATAFDHIGTAILHEWPSYVGYATSFITVGGIWLAHHGVFRLLRFASDRVMRINLLLLMAVAFLPFPTRLVAEALRDENASRVAAIFYGISLLVISLLFAALWWTVARERSLVSPELSADEVRRLLRASLPMIALSSLRSRTSSSRWWGSFGYEVTKCWRRRTRTRRPSVG